LIISLFHGKRWEDVEAKDRIVPRRNTYLYQSLIALNVSQISLKYDEKLLAASLPVSSSASIKNYNGMGLRPFCQNSEQKFMELLFRPGPSTFLIGSKSLLAILELGSKFREVCRGYIEHAI
jgi:hypothetical protein